jgi:AbrB family looped-hinge helix DNA binding protein
MKIMERGQITIPKKLRDIYGLKTNMEIDIVPVDEGLLIVKRGGGNSQFKEVYGILNKKGNSDDYIEKIRGR